MSEVTIVDPKTGGKKGQKDERFDLIPMDALEELARVYGFGAKKYDDDNWLKGYAWRLSLGALGRHVAKWALGQDRDPETGLHHLAHAAWHCLALMVFGMRGLGTDDIPTRKTPDSKCPPASKPLGVGDRVVFVSDYYEVLQHQQGTIRAKDESDKPYGVEADSRPESEIGLYWVDDEDIKRA